jgi:hypothetical protein
MKPKNTSTPAPQLHTHVLNSNEKRQLSRVMFETDLPRFCELVKTNGGLFETDIGTCELRIFPGDGHVVIGLKCRGESVALAALASEDFIAKTLWEEMIQQHSDMLRGIGRPVPSSLAKKLPASVPWMAASMAPSYVDRASPIDVHRVLATLWTTAFAIMAQRK